jgi:hypothetical protein
MLNGSDRYAVVFRDVRFGRRPYFAFAFFTHKNFAAEYIIDFATHGVIGPLGDQFQSHEPENRRGEKGLRDGCFLLGRIWEAGTRSRFALFAPHFPLPSESARNMVRSGIDPPTALGLVVNCLRFPILHAAHKNTVAPKLNARITTIHAMEPRMVKSWGMVMFGFLKFERA